MATKTFKIGLSNTDKQNMAQDVYERLLDLTFAEYDSGETYNEGDFVVYEDALYKCLEDNVSGAWDSTKWESATLQDLLDDVEGAVASVNGKANIIDLENGTIVPEKSRTAINLLPVSSTSGSTQTAPFINQGTATNNNDAQAEVDTGTLGQHLEKQGNTVCVNQKINITNQTSTLAGMTLTCVASTQIVTVSGTATTGYGSFTNASNFIQGHRYLCLANVSKNTNNKSFTIITLGAVQPGLSVDITGIGIFASIKAASVSTSSNNIGLFNLTINDSYDVEFTYKIIDLDQWFNGDIPQDLLDNPSNFFRYYNGDLSYNTGTLVNSNGRYLVNGQSENVWDEDWEQGQINYSGNNVASNNQIRSKNYIQVVPNRTYSLYYGAWSLNKYGIMLRFYDKDKNYIGSDYASCTTFTTPSNCKYMRFCTNADAVEVTSYANNITISLYYEGEDYSEYVPYKAPAIYDTGTEVLRSAGSVKDYKDPDGTIHRLVDSYTFTGEETFIDRGTNQAGLQIYVCDITSILNYKYENNVSGISNKGLFLPTNSGTENIQGRSDAKGLSLYYQADQPNTRYIYFVGYTTTEIVGLTIQLPLNEPTTEQGTPFSENMDINDMGNMAWYSAYTDENTNTLVSVPQGCKIFYPAWYAGFIDSLGQREDIDWASEQVVSQEQLGVVSNRVPALSQSAEDGTYTLKATKSGDTITYYWLADSE